jgi:hypothetical protein
VRAVIEADPENRAVAIIAESDDFYRADGQERGSVRRSINVISSAAGR